jgi:hypothetical protein
VVEIEIRVKLFYLEMIHKLREGCGVRKADVASTLVLRIKTGRTRRSIPRY